MSFIKDQLVVITQSLDGDCGMFSVSSGTIAKVVRYDQIVHRVRIVVTPHDKGFITTDELNVRNLTCCEIALALAKFTEIPICGFKPVIL